MRKFKTWLNETTFVGGGNIRGTGNVTGESPGDTLAYIGANLAAADTHNDQMKSLMQNFHDKFHGKGR
jgi:hypothetical protein